MERAETIALLDLYINNFRTISLVGTILITIIVLIIRFIIKKWNFKAVNLELGDLVNIMLISYTIPTAFLLMLGCADVSKLSVVTEISIYIIIAGIALLYVAVSSLMKIIKKNSASED
jgi:hypothetical protein